VSASVWEPAPERLALPEGEVHVWRRALPAPPERLAQLRALLSADERERAERFRREQDRQEFESSRGYLRELLGYYLEADPAGLRFDYNPQGKPEVPGDLRFNVSHSGGLALYAFSRARAVGIDLERHRSDVAHDSIAERFFSPAEVEALRTLPESGRLEGFFNCWTRKEAYVKARGESLIHPLRAFDVSLVPGEPARLLATRPDPAEASRWWMRALDLGPGWSAAVLAERPVARLRRFR
jgi:4'-phosphopantetheinyl transferase